MAEQLHINDALYSSPPNSKRFYTIAIDGRGGSGKSKLADHLAKLLCDFVFVNGDAYFEPVQDEIVWGAFNEARFEHDVIEPLGRGSNFVIRPYTWGAESPISERAVTVTTGLCLERCFSFALDLDWDLKLWVETPRSVCLERGVARDSHDLPAERVIAAWRDVWQPNEDAYIRDQRPHERADFIVDGTKSFDIQITQ